MPDAILYSYKRDEKNISNGIRQFNNLDTRQEFYSVGRSQLHQPIGKEEERNNFRFNPFLYLLTLINPY